jgi:hypothetical protein
MKVLRTGPSGAERPAQAASIMPQLEQTVGQT